MFYVFAFITFFSSIIKNLIYIRMPNPDMQTKMWHFVIHQALIIFLLFSFVSIVAGGRTVINFQPMEMNRGEILSYFKSTYLTKLTSFDKMNEEVYQSDTFSEDLFHNIDNLIPRRVFIKMLMKTKNITDKVDGKGISLTSSYQNELNSKCSAASVFNLTTAQILQSWDGDRSIVANDIDRWHDANRNVPYTQLCNRFRGLTCQFKTATSPETDQGMAFEVSDKPTCQCSGDPVNVGFYKNPKAKGKPTAPYGDGCYIRPWRPCRHLSLDNTFRDDYKPWHKSMENYKRQLVQMAYPVGRTPRCKEGTYCLDLVPDMAKPICWCNQNSYDPECIATANDQSKKVALGPDLSRIRKAFMKIIIHSNDTKSPCNSEYNEKVWSIVNSLGKDPRGKAGIVEIMRELAFSQKKVQICDFRQALICDGFTNTCRGKLTCDPGKVHLGKGVCAVNNGFRCQSTEECVENARCKNIQGTMDSVCVCVNGYGNKCELEHRSFFMSRFLPIISGYEGNEFISLQVEVNNVIESWEDSLKQNFDEPCDPKGDSISMDIVKYFGNLHEYDKDLGSSLMKRITSVLKDGPKLCDYTKFLRCDQIKQKCVPILGSYLAQTGSSNWANPGRENIVVEVEPEKECVLTVPLIFEGIVSFRCVKGYNCKKIIGSAICTPDCSSIFAPAQECSEAQNEVDETTTDASDSSFESNSNILETKTNDGTHDLDARVHNELVDILDVTTTHPEMEVTTDPVTTISLNVDDLNFHELGKPVSQETTVLPLPIVTTDPPVVTTVAANIETITFAPTLPEDSQDNATTLKPDITTTTTTTEKIVTLATPTTYRVPVVEELSLNESFKTTTKLLTSTSNPVSARTTSKGKNKTLVVTPKAPWKRTTKQTTPTPRSLDVEVEDNTVSSLVRKARFGEMCLYNDNRQYYPPSHKIDICDSADYLICVHEVCECYPGLKYSVMHKKCVVPIGEKCQENGFSLPVYMNMHKLPCEFGVCKVDNVGKICRPETDVGLTLIGATNDAKFDDDDDDDNEARRLSQGLYIVVIGMLFLVVIV